MYELYGGTNNSSFEFLSEVVPFPMYYVVTYNSMSDTLIMYECLYTLPLFL